MIKMYKAFLARILTSKKEKEGGVVSVQLMSSHNLNKAILHGEEFIEKTKYIEAEMSYELMESLLTSNKNLTAYEGFLFGLNLKNQIIDLMRSELRKKG